MATETHGAVAEAADHAASGAGMPQLDFAHFPNQIFWLVVTLVVIYLILNRVALPRIGAVLAHRASTITNDIAAANDLKRKAEEAEQAYDKALADARVEAGRIAAEAKAEIQADLNAAIAKADTQISVKTAEGEKAIAEIRAGAVDGIRAVAKDVAAELVTTLGFKADKGTIDGAVEDRVKG
ncbi:F0F1 ATP synthase subunit B' [Pseudooceanicola sp.]|uniref:F0F1 ATP synthase subunit B' n=1 Tax=Pseudooceanicola sp. TaxID=1914328 RepID=UPI002609DE6F|nr:F0F1 ATP synthase subunit B' [Pseudooceanicola sp.]MDF1856707.1 F0F1 ATP synthase subunit B' [Pseudooceanicola sp.]